MTDARFPERWLNDRRILRLPDDAFRMFVTGLAWSVSNRTNGVIFDDDLELLPRVTPPAAAHLAAAGLWTRQEDGGFWVIADFGGTQTTREQLEATELARKKARDKKRKQRAAAAPSPGTSPGTTQARPGQARKGQAGTEGDGYSPR
jgi:hypothetical protein